MDDCNLLQAHTTEAGVVNGGQCGRGIEPMRQARQYFECHLPRLVGTLLLKDFAALTCRFDVCLVDDSPATYRLAIAGGRLVAADGAPGAAQAVYTLDSETLIDIVTARVTPQDAFFDVRVDISGDMESGLELGAVFEEFFRFHPYKLQAFAYDVH